MNNSSTQPPKLLIGLTGLAGSGKDTVAELIHDASLPCFVIVDVRTLPEVAAIHALRGAVWRVERPGIEPTGEARLEFVEADRTIVNDGTLAELRSQVGYELARLNYEKTGLVGSTERDGQ